LYKILYSIIKKISYSFKKGITGVNMKIEVLIFISTAAIFAVSCSGKLPGSIGVKEGKLAQCPDKPNCVSSMTEDKSHYIEPFNYTGSSGKVKSVILELVKSQDRTKIITDSENYIHAEFRSKLFRFVDDVEFLIDDRTKTVHVRSASRTGYSDMGVNRKRVENLHTLFNEKIK
jgi:uncharacterized protein (DUF1499 family)